MKQVLQDLRSGETELVEAPCPAPGAGHVLIRSSRSLISAGTERMLVQFGKAGWLEKARQQPDKVRMVLNKVRTDGLLPTLASVRNKLSEPIAPGYCNVGTVIALGAGVTALRVGDRVVSNGKHAEVVSVPLNLCAAVPAEVSDDEAVFTVIAAVALQGIRLIRPTLGESVVVIGLGLVGLITVQLLRAHGCRVLGVDFDRDKLDLAKRFGADVVDLSAGEDPVSTAQVFARGRGVDAVIIAASTKSNEPVHQAAVMCRKQGRIVLVGVTGLELSRADFYEKELTFQVSCSYGPGRYDPEYEQKGRDYPAGYVRWTEQRNFEAVLDMLSDRRVDFRALVSHRMPLERAADAYALLTGSAPSLGIVLEYADAGERDCAGESRTISLRPAPAARPSPVPTVGVIGAGGYATAVLIPALQRTGVRLRSVASSGGVSAVHAGRKFAFETATTDAAGILADPEVDAVVVCTRHDTHARFACEALSAGKHVFVEKPLAIDTLQLDQIETTYRAAAQAGPPLVMMVGFNRRFAPHVVRLKSLLDAVREPKAFVMTVNAGAIPAEHWTQDAETGGGRIIGEACHFIDLLRFLAGASICRVTARMLGAPAVQRDDKVSVTLEFSDGSLGTVHYLANGHRSFPKERLEVFCAGRIAQLDNFRKLRAYGWPGFRSMSLWSQDKGNAACAAAFVEAVRAGGPSPIAFDELLEVTRASFEAVSQLRSPC
jgi:predicted dehydrogenase/threonine dehydrogenase-like Zn-dependent dehydrogenase